MPTKPAAARKKSARHKAKPSRNERAERPREINGPRGPEPTRYGDWEVGGRCSDF